MRSPPAFSRRPPVCSAILRRALPLSITYTITLARVQVATVAAISVSRSGVRGNAVVNRTSDFRPRMAAIESIRWRNDGKRTLWAYLSSVPGMAARMFGRIGSPGARGGRPIACTESMARVKGSGMAVKFCATRKEVVKEATARYRPGPAPALTKREASRRNCAIAPGLLLAPSKNNST